MPLVLPKRATVVQQNLQPLRDARRFSGAWTLGNRTSLLRPFALQCGAHRHEVAPRHFARRLFVPFGCPRSVLRAAYVHNITGSETVFISPVTIAELRMGLELMNDKTQRLKALAAFRRLKRKPR